MIPLIDLKDAMHAQRLREAQYVAAWQMPPLSGPWEVAWQGPDGLLLRRTR